MKSILAVIVLATSLYACGGAEQTGKTKFPSRSNAVCYATNSTGQTFETYWGLDDQCHDAATDAVLNPQPACCDPNQTFCTAPDGSSCGDAMNGLAPAALLLVK